MNMAHHASLLVPVLVLAAPLLFTAAAALFVWRLLAQQGGGQLAQSYQQSPVQRLIPLSYPAQPAASEGNSPPSSPQGFHLPK